MQHAFPGRIAGASLKQLEVARGAMTALSFPRQNRRGLIEARVRSRRSRISWSTFPGRIAGASLKPTTPAIRARESHPLSPAESPGPH